MNLKDQEQSWRELSEEVTVGLREWRVQHPQATLGEIEEALDEGLARLRARMLQDSALASQAREWHGETEGVKCPACGTPLKARGHQERHLQTTGGQEVVLRRMYGECPTCQVGFFPPG